MRPKFDAQPELEFPVSKLALTQEYYAKYQAISRILDENPEILSFAHRDLAHALEQVNNAEDRGRFRFTTDQVVRLLIVQVVENLSLRQTVVRVDDSPALRQFTRIGRKRMMDFTTLGKLKNAIRPETWKCINRSLARFAVREECLSGEALRLDTTAVETNIHYPTDSALLWDTYRVLARLIERAREVDARAVGSRRLQVRPAKRDHLAITRKAAQRGLGMEALQPRYRRLIGRVEGICEWAASVRERLVRGLEGRRYPAWKQATAEALVQELAPVHALGLRVIDQARRRVLQGESVPNEQKLFSLFEPHTELLLRGKAGKPVEYGHMIQIQQVCEKFITDYDVFAKRPVEPALLAAALASHVKLFGELPSQLTAEKGYYESMAALEALEQQIEVVSIAKKGKRTPAQKEREEDPLFRHAQAFRAGVEGTISFLKRVLGLGRCLNKGWEHFVSTVGQAIFAHNLIVLARA